MDGMDMDMDMGMDGMDMTHTGMTGIGSDLNHAFARDYWYIAAFVVGLLAAIRTINHLGALQRIKASHDPAVPQPTSPHGRLSQAWATATAIAREISHPQLYIPLHGLSWATPPPLGRLLLLAAYWSVIAYFMSSRAVLHDVNYYERIGYRNAWVTLTQLPMLYLLSAKINPLAWLVGSSHERLNWLHRWVARTMFVTATVHGFHFYTEWLRADFVSFEISVMPMVKYGLGAWAVLLWSVVVGFLPLRSAAYEIWLLQHVASSVVMLVLVYLHVPTNARPWFWTTVSFFLFDRAARWALLLKQNVRLASFFSVFRADSNSSSSSTCRGSQPFGHRITLRAVGDATTVAVVKDVHFPWSAGQHLYLWIPRLGPLDAHPYTIACAHRIRGTCCCNSIHLIVRKHAGFSRRLHAHALKHPDVPLTGFLSGPYGAPPRWDIFETMVLIGASTGASFTVSILESAAYSASRACLRRMDVVLLAKTAPEIEYYVHRSRDASKALRAKGVDVRLHIAVTQSDSNSNLNFNFNFNANPSTPALGSLADSHSTKDTETGPETPFADKSCCCTKPPPDDDDDDDDDDATPDASKKEDDSAEVITEYTSRPDIEALIRDPVEQAWGETAVVACGGKEVVARARNCVAALSDERAVHKGTGAQGIYLHVEEYSF